MRGVLIARVFTLIETSDNIQPGIFRNIAEFDHIDQRFIFDCAR